MSFALLATFVGLGAIGGFAAGLLGFGGGVLMFPLLYYAPPLLSLERMDAKTVAAIVASQVFFSTLIGGIAHFRGGRVHAQVAVIAGTLSAVSAFAGSLISQWSSEGFLLLLFGGVTLLVVLIMLFPAPLADETAVEKVTVRRLPLVLISLLTGLVIGFLGAGNFIFVPILIYLLRVPTRIAIGSSLLIALMNTASGFLGKLITGQIPFLTAGLVVGGATIGAVLGERVHRQLSSRMLRKIYAFLVVVIAARVWLTILGFDS